MSKHPNQRKLTDDQAITIRYLVGSGKLSARSAASQYGVSPKTVAGIMAGYLYKPKAVLTLAPPTAGDEPRSYGLAGTERRAMPRTRTRKRRRSEHALPAATSLYRSEKAKRDERRKLNPQMTEAQRAFAAILERDRQQGRGGRPKGSRNGQHYAAKPGKPMLELRRNDPLDLTPYLGEFYGRSA